jgi:hypothetical protein
VTEESLGMEIGGKRSKAPVRVEGTLKRGREKEEL